MKSDIVFDQLIQEALSQELVGWNFSYLEKRTRETKLPWDYRQIVLDRVQTAGSLLDLGTGGGEFLSSLAPLPANTWATEGYPPNVAVARQRLEPLGVQVVDVSGMDDKLPFHPGLFELVINRHTGYEPGEVNRVLCAGGRFVMQQVGGENCMGLNRSLQEEPYCRYAGLTLAKEVRQLGEAGFRILDQREAFPTLTFLDIAAVVFYLKAIPWQIEDFSVEKYRFKLYQIHQIIQQEGGFDVKQHRWLILAEKIKSL